MKALWKPRIPHLVWRFDALAAWALGAGFAALMGHIDANITPAPALDSIIVSALGYVMFRWLTNVYSLKPVEQSQ